ncbi:16S rRNA (guanine(527)-N(7))-methyltransferase RsmG [Nitrospirillum iridis]|uniref:Ribosomal RNA small subunit methyltransferase G n=1 Tax=Nitrospirillum iridis TaxID=765888 RepID=A0A7X0B3U1_9PROT|nr:16S rRNA (guanine(527)-N(7))-methyltransferase RsmG [Nitrospirillum iridis]MBB6254867.1 16S rRNA (guanine527-N7)-methyltransferase [Nitrospirillum iridis]
MTPADFAARFGVSRETLDRLTVYAQLLAKWNPAINLVAKSTVAEVWERHMADSAQLYALLPPNTRTQVDMGSGAGFPGLVMAILGVPDVHMIESDTRKATFLREVARATGTPVTVHAQRIEQAPDIAADVVTARALAALPDLLEWGHRFLKPGGHCLFLKGRTAADELTLAAESWTMTVSQIPSMTDASGTILILGEIARAR